MRWSAKADSSHLPRLLEYQADVNLSDDAGETALIKAARLGHRDQVAGLIEAGAEVNAKDNNGDTALSLATAGRHEGIARLLADAGARE